MGLKEKLQVNNMQLAVLCVAAALTLFGVVETILHLNAEVPISKTVFMCLSYVVVIYYALVGYKTPHGNLLKYTMWFFVFMLIHNSALGAGGVYHSPDLQNVSMLFSSLTTTLSIAIVSYLSGRLDRFKKSMILCTVVLVLLIVRALLMSNYRTLMFANLSDVIIWFDICCVYGVRYVQHREAGLES